MWTLTSFKAGMVWEGFEGKTSVKLSPREQGEWVREMGRAVWIGWCSEWAREETSVEPGHSESRPETGSGSGIAPALPFFPSPVSALDTRGCLSHSARKPLLTFEPGIHRPPFSICSLSSLFDRTSHLVRACEFPSWTVASLSVSWSQVYLVVRAQSSPLLVKEKKWLSCF